MICKVRSCAVLLRETSVSCRFVVVPEQESGYLLMLSVSWISALVWTHSLCQVAGVLITTRGR